jgi:hypothetical protein
MAGFEQPFGILDGEAEFVSFAAMSDGSGDVILQGSHLGAPVPSVGLAVEIAGTHSQVMFAIRHLAPTHVEERMFRVRREKKAP